MPSIFDGLDDLCDRWLGVDANWQGQPPRYESRTTLQGLCQNGWTNGASGQKLMWDLFGRISMNWNGGRCTGLENWRFTKHLDLAEQHRGPEVTLERTIANITDDNWANQVPTSSGINDTGPHHLDLIHRTGSNFTFIELKVDSNHPLSAALQIVMYSMVYVFSRIHAEDLGYDLNSLDLLRANQVHLQVLAPAAYFSPARNNVPAVVEWLRDLEACLNTGLEQFARTVSRLPMGFKFTAFPESFVWNSANRHNAEFQRDLLWAIRNRQGLDGQILQPFFVG